MTRFIFSLSLPHGRKNELHQVAQQASNIEDLIEVIRASLSVMSKQWSDAMHTFREKFDSLSSLIIDHGNFLIGVPKILFSISAAYPLVDFYPMHIGLDSSSQEEFLSLLGGARTSPPVHQFLVNSLGESVNFALCNHFSPFSFGEKEINLHILINGFLSK